MRSLSSTYPMDNAGPRRDSALPVATPARGHVTWSRDLNRPAEPDAALTVLTWQGGVLVTTPSSLMRFDRSGARHWMRAKKFLTPAVVSCGSVYFQAPSHDLVAVDTDNRVVLAETPFPSATTDAVRIQLLWPREKDFVAAVYFPAELEVPEGDPPDTKPPAPELTALKNRYGVTYGDWGPDFVGHSRLPALFDPDTHRMTVMTHEAIRLDVDQEKELSRFPLPLTNVAAWSVSADEVYFLLGREGAAKVVVAHSAREGELWRWVEPVRSQPSELWVPEQPPILSRDGRVYALTSRSVLAIERGRLAWTYPLPEEATRGRASGLADGSLLVAAGKRLIHLGADGVKRFEVPLDEEARSAPVVAEEGEIYVATQRRLVRID